MNDEELKRQTDTIAKCLDAAMEELLNKYDSRLVLSVALGRAAGLALQMREAGTFGRDDTVLYFGAALANAAKEMENGEATEV